MFILNSFPSSFQLAAILFNKGNNLGIPLLRILEYMIAEITLSLRTNKRSKVD